jgi:hypothetical protein
MYNLPVTLIVIKVLGSVALKGPDLPSKAAKDSGSGPPKVYDIFGSASN